MKFLYELVTVNGESSAISPLAGMPGRQRRIMIHKSGDLPRYCRRTIVPATRCWPLRFLVLFAFALRRRLLYYEELIFGDVLEVRL